MRLPLYVLQGLLVALFSASAGAAKPSILFLLTDDQTYDAIHALGWEEVQTPNLDKLVARGVAFTHAYNQGSWSGAVCVASRTMLITGRTLWHAKQDEKQLDQRYVETKSSWPQRMQAAGYRTCLTGKWHVRVDPAVVFEDARHVRPGMAQDAPEMYNRPRDGLLDPFDPSNPAKGGHWDGGKHWSEVVADDAIAMLSAPEGDDRPFFIYAAFNAPHDPRQAPAEYQAMYPREKMSVPASFLPEYPYAEAMGAGRNLRDERLAPFPRTAHAMRVHRAEYAAIITHLDAQIGRILNAIEERGLGDHTYVVLTSDHGLAIGKHGLMGKQNMYEHSMRAPLILAGPGIPSGKQIAARVYLQDVVPTTLELADADQTAIEFQSLVPLIFRTPRADDLPVSRTAIYGAYLDRQRMIIVEPWKLIVYPEVSKLRLYNLEADPEEMTDLAEQDEFQSTVQRLLAQLREQQRKLDDPLDLPSDHTGS